YFSSSLTLKVSSLDIGLNSPRSLEALFIKSLIDLPFEVTYLLRNLRDVVEFVELISFFLNR
ncbi:MAG: hypothetical protein U9R17_04765, partial [Thermodesulfobacteriota bacterium]|nr:hypothetical protein [Thermodesulfobacteriota bacterium]